jgi:hypothetical protein
MMRMARFQGIDQSILAAALLGYEAQRNSITAKIEAIKAQLGGSTRKVAAAPAAAAPKARKAHRISPEGLKRIRDAQKRRWAAAKAKAASA